MDSVKEAKTMVIDRKMSGHFFDKLSFLLKARSDDAGRSYMCGLHIEESDGDAVGICTDGHRLHIWNDFPSGWISPGEWTVKSATTAMIILEECAEDITFPDWKKTMPKKEGRKEINFALEGRSLKKREISSFSQVAAVLAIESGCIVNLSYLNDLSGHVWTVYHEKPDKSILFENEHLTALIMPMAKA